MSVSSPLRIVRLSFQNLRTDFSLSMFMLLIKKRHSLSSSFGSFTSLGKHIETNPKVVVFFTLFGSKAIIIWELLIEIQDLHLLL